MSDDKHETHEAARQYHMDQPPGTDFIDTVCAFKAGAQWRLNYMRFAPTHYAVIDEHGEIVTAYSIDGYPDSESICRREISEIAGEIPQAKDWTVKGVTVHE